MAVQDAASVEEDGKALYLAKCVQKSSVVLQAVCGHIRSPLTVDVVFGKETTLELVVLAEDGSAQSVCEQPVFGNIKDMKILTWNESCRAPELQTYGKDLLVLLSDSGKLSFLTFSVEFHRFLAASQIHLSHPGISLRDLGWLLAVECRGRAVAVAAFEDQLAVFPTSIAAGNNVVDKGIKYPIEPVTSTGVNNTSVGVETSGWGTIWSMVFVSGSNECSSSKQGSALVLAVLLHRKGALSNELEVLVCDPHDRSIQLRARYNPSGELAGALLTFSVLEVPACPGFLLLLRLGDIVLVDVSTTSTPYVADVVASALLDFSGAEKCTVDKLAGKRDDNFLEGGSAESFGCTNLPFVCAWCWEPDNTDEPRLVFSLNTGDIYIASFHHSTSGRPSLVLSECQYKCSPCKVLLWTNGGFIAAMVEMGDGQVLKVEKGKLTRQSLIQNIAPIIDFSLADYYGEKQDQMFACCGVGQEGSLRVIRNGNRVEKLISTPPVYHGVTGIWTIRICFKDPYHAFFVISFVEETRVLSVGLNFVDITDAVGFDSLADTLACGLVEDGWIAQVCSREVRLCSPTKAAHPAGVDYRAPLCTSWKPQGFCINLGVVSHGKVILALSRPGLLLMLGTEKSSAGIIQLVELQHCLLEAEVSCISIPQELSSIPVPPTIVGLHARDAFPAGVQIGNICVVGTHKPSVELLSIVPGENFAPLAVGQVSLISSIGTAMSGCIPQDVRLALFDRLYILTGLRNGMLLRYEWPDSSPPSLFLPPELSGISTNDDKGTATCTKPAQLHLIAVRRLGVSPVFLVPLEASLRADIIAMSDRPWLLQIARHSQRIAYTSISFQPSTHATPVCSQDCPKGILFMADCSLHLVEMEHSRTLNVQKLPLASTPRRVLYHAESKTLLVMRAETTRGSSDTMSDLSCIDPLTGAVHSCFTFGPGEVAKCMQLIKVGYDQLLLVGTSLSTQRPIMPSGEAESSKGHLMVVRLEMKNRKVVPSLTASPTKASSSTVLEPSAKDATLEGHMFSDIEEWELTSKTTVGLPGAVLAVAPYLGQYVLASAGNSLFCLGFSNEGPIRLKKLTSVKTRFLITSISVHFTTIAVGDCRDGILLYTFREDTRKLEQLHCDPMQRLVADCVMVDLDTAVVMDRRGNFCALSSANAQESPSPEKNVTVSCWFHMGEISMSISKGSFAYKVPVEEACNVGRFMHNVGNTSVVASTLLGSVVIFIRVSREEYNLLEAVQTRLALYPLTVPVLGNNHARFRGQGCPADAKNALDGDMLAQFLELTSAQQLAVLREQPCSMPEGWVPGSMQASIPIEQVLRLLERVHHALT